MCRRAVKQKSNQTKTFFVDVPWNPYEKNVKTLHLLADEKCINCEIRTFFCNLYIFRCIKVPKTRKNSNCIKHFFHNINSEQDSLNVFVFSWKFACICDKSKPEHPPNFSITVTSSKLTGAQLYTNVTGVRTLNV